MAQEPLSISAPSLPKGGGAIQSLGKGWAAVGMTGAASVAIPLPITAGRGYAPALSLSYSSAGGRTEFGQGWSINRPCISRQTSKGTPQYEPDSNGKMAEPVYLSPSGDVLLPVRNASGQPATRTASAFRGRPLTGNYAVTAYRPRVEGEFSTLEHYVGATGSFWLIQLADGSAHVYGHNENARLQHRQGASTWVAEWFLEESVAANGEHVLYEYLSENDKSLNTLTGPTAVAWQGRDSSTHRYLQRARYGNLTGDRVPYVLQQTVVPEWLFDLVFDYGEADTRLTTTPLYPRTPGSEWPLRADPTSNYRYGFEERTLRLCHQVLMFHWCADGPGNSGPVLLQDEPVLVQRLQLEYNQQPAASLLTAAHVIGYAGADAQFNPPLEFAYSTFTLTGESASFSPFFAAQSTRQDPGIDAGLYQLVDLYGDGLAGILYCLQNAWYYRRPIRDPVPGQHQDAVTYAPRERLEHIPVANLGSSTIQALTDITGDGQLDWLLAQPALAGFFTLDSHRQWRHFTPFAAFPSEFFSPQSQLASLMGSGLSDLAMIGTRSVRLYANQQSRGFDSPLQVARQPGETSLPVVSDERYDLVAFSDLLGSGQQHLVRICAQGVSCWPNLGGGRFGEPVNFGKLEFAGEFNPAHIRLADLDGSGAADILYWQSGSVQVFMNLSGHGFAPPVTLALPAGLRYDSLTSISVADLQGLGCSSLVVTSHTHLPALAPDHWRCDFVAGHKPYLLCATDNNMGTSGEVVYRSSAQEWLDEKAQLPDPSQANAEMPFPIHVVSEQHQLDQITGNHLAQFFSYRHAYYDGAEREFRGFGLLLQTDTETSSASAEGQGFTAPVLSKTWFHTGKALHMPADDGWDGDERLAPLGDTLCTQRIDGTEQLHTDWDASTLHDAARTLSGSVLRTETLGADGNPVPYSVTQNRYGVRLLQARSDTDRYCIMLPVAFEQRSLNYERQADDPLCQHQINLAIDDYGSVTHSVSVACARRAGILPPYPDNVEHAHLRRWWQDARDDAQQCFYLSESQVRLLHVRQTDYLRLGLPYRSQQTAYVIPSIEQIGYEAFIGPQSPLGTTPLNGQRILAGQSRVQYQGCADGTVNFDALPEYSEQAELDATALQAYVVKDDQGAETNLLGTTPEQVNARLAAAGYTDVGQWRPASNTVDTGINLWASRTGYSTFAGVEHFNLLLEQKPVVWVTPSRVSYDNLWLLPDRFTAPDSGITDVIYTYSTLQAKWIRDPNQNVSEARYDAMGRVVLTTFWGTEWDEASQAAIDVGFANMASHTWVPASAHHAIADSTVMGDMAAAMFYEPCSWMGQAAQTLLPNGVELGVLMPGGYLRASARARLAKGEYPPDQLPAPTCQALLALPREPAWSAVLQADRYPGDLQRQVRMQISAADGFGRALQSKQKVEAGLAYAVDDEGNLQTLAGEPQQVQANERWRVSERVEYNNKGLAVRVYRPYFANHHRYINDESFRLFGYCDQQFYDPLGRPTQTITASGYWRRQTYLTWYSIAEDENDLYQEMLDSLRAATVVQAQGDQLEPMQALTGVTVQVEYPGMLPTDRITLNWTGVEGAGTPALAEKPGNLSGGVLFDIPKNAVGANLGRTVEVSYRVSRAGGLLQSEVLNLNIATLPMAQISNKIFVEKETGGILDIALAPNGVNVDILTWPFIAIGQKVWLSLEGQKADGSPHILTLWTAALVNGTEVNQGYLRKVAGAAYLQQLADGCTLEVTFKVAFTGSDPTQALAFPVKTLGILNSANPPL